MIWKQDGDPPHTRRAWLEAQRYGAGSFQGPAMIPTARDIWFATAHEAADTVTQILGGDGICYGLGQYAVLWRREPEIKIPRRLLDPDVAREIREETERQRIAAMAERRAIRLRERANDRRSRRIERLQEWIAAWERHLFFISEHKERQTTWFKQRIARQRRWRHELRVLLRAHHADR